MALSTNASANCTFQSGISNGNHLARATVLFKSIGYDAQPGLIVGVRLIPRFKRADEIFSIDGAPLALNHKLCRKVTELPGSASKLVPRFAKVLGEHAQSKGRAEETVILPERVSVLSTMT